MTRKPKYSQVNKEIMEVTQIFQLAAGKTKLYFVVMLFSPQVFHEHHVTIMPSWLIWSLYINSQAIMYYSALFCQISNSNTFLNQ